MFITLLGNRWDNIAEQVTDVALYSLSSFFID